MRGYHHRVAPQDLTERELDAWRTSFQMFELLRNRIERQLHDHSGLSMADYSVLSLLSDAPGGRLRVFELGRAAGWEKSRLHHQLTRMTRRGLVKREPCGSRGMDAVITADGREAIETAAPSHSAQVRALFVDRLTAEQLRQFADMAGIVLDGLRAEEDA